MHKFQSGNINNIDRYICVDPSCLMGGLRRLQQMHSNVTFPGTVPIIGIFAVALIFFFYPLQKIRMFFCKRNYIFFLQLGNTVLILG